MEAKHRLQTNDENWHQIWKEDGEGRELPYCEIVNTDKETVDEVFRAVNTFDQARIALIQLRNEIVGTVGLAEAVLRNTVGNTNMAILQEKIKQAERCIAAMEVQP